MTTKIISLTPAELIAQSNEMKALGSAYEDLFKGVTAELKKVNSSWSANLAHNFSGKITASNRCFIQLTENLATGAEVAAVCARTFESVDSQLAKAYGTQGEETTTTSSSDTSIIQTVDDVMGWVEKTFNSLPASVQNIIKKQCGDWIDAGATVQDVIGKLQKGDYWGAIWETAETFLPNMFGEGIIGSLKKGAVKTVIGLVTDSDGYIAKNMEKYTDLMIQNLNDGDIPGLLGNMFGSFSQTVGKGAVDAACQTISGTIDSITEGICGVSLSDFNSAMYDVLGWSPGHIFNDIGATLSDVADDVIDGGIEIVTTVADTVGDVVSGTVDVVSTVVGTVGDVVSGTADVVGTAISTAGKVATGIGDFIKSWF